MLLNSTENMPQLSVPDKKESGEEEPLLNPEQIRVGSKVIMTHAERQKFWKNCAQAELFGCKDW